MLAPSWTRAEHRRRLGEAGSFDVVVVGGGVIGCGVALDLTTRGFRVALIEQADWASGTSGRSTKLFHGGIRYLPHFRFQLVAEGLREQRVLARIADYLFQTLEFVVPVYDQHGLADAPAWASRGRRASIALGAGLIVYDLLGGFNRPGERHRCWWGAVGALSSTCLPILNGRMAHCSTTDDPSGSRRDVTGARRRWGFSCRAVSPGAAAGTVQDADATRAARGRRST